MGLKFATKLKKIKKKLQILQLIAIIKKWEVIREQMDKLCTKNEQLLEVAEPEAYLSMLQWVVIGL